jgi:transcriptional regulator GlxA family with amidase domain
MKAIDTRPVLGRPKRSRSARGGDRWNPGAGDLNLQAMVERGTQPRRRRGRDRAPQLFLGISSGQAITHAGVAKSLRYISVNYCRPIRVSDLEKIGGLSRRGFLKAFRKHTGVSPAQVLRQLRVERAKRLLVECDLPLEQLAAQCGFRSANSFWVAFREVTGVAPKQFQRHTWLENYRVQLSNGTAGKRM